MSEPITQADIARKYRDEYGMEMAIRKLARIMYDENKLSFKDYEAARMALRRVEGKSKGSTVKVTHPHEARPVNPYGLPASDETTYEPYVIPERNVLVLSDVHIPYHSISAVTAAITWAKTKKIDAILLNGDIIDAHQLSRFVRDPKKRQFSEELDMLRDFVQVLNTEFPKAKIYYKFGNHELRYDHYLMMKAHELIGVHEFKLSSIIKNRVPSAETIGDKKIIHLGSLNVIHGHEFGHSFFSPVNPARGLFLRAKVSSLQAHSHSTSEHSETDINGKLTTTWSIGCLSELHPDYLPINKWNHGFGLVNVHENDDFNVTNVRIYKGNIL